MRKLVLIVLAITFLVPRPALAVTAMPPFDEHLADLDDGLATILSEIDGVIASFAEDKKTAKALAKAKSQLARFEGFAAQTEWTLQLEEMQHRALWVRGLTDGRVVLQSRVTEASIRLTTTVSRPEWFPDPISSDAEIRAWRRFSERTESSS